MDKSKFLAKVLGLYFIIISVALFTNRAQFGLLVLDLINNAPLMFVTGFFVLILGLGLVVSHNIWQWDWRVLITITSWIILFKALTILFYRPWIDEMTILFVQNVSADYIAGGVNFILGVLLCYFGFRR